MIRSTRPGARLDRPAPWAPSTGGVRLVQVEEGVVAFGDLAQPGHVGPVAVHAEHAFGDDEAHRLAAGAGLGAGRQQAFQVVQVVMAVADLLHAGGLAAVVQAGVVELVGIELDLALAGGGAQQRGQHGGVGLPARGQQQGGLGALEPGQLGLDLFVQVQVAADQSRGLGAGAAQRSIRAPARPAAGGAPVPGSRCWRSSAWARRSGRCGRRGGGGGAQAARTRRVSASASSEEKGIQLRHRQIRGRPGAAGGQAVECGPL